MWVVVVAAARWHRPLKESHTDIVLDLLTLPSLEIVASASMDHTVRLWDMHTGKARKTLTGHTKGVRSMAYSPDYRFLVSAGFDYDALVGLLLGCCSAWKWFPHRHVW